MALHCLKWIPHLWVQLVNLFKVHGVKHFPDDVVIEILSRLPAEHVVKCRRVCRQWQALTSTPSFAELHLKRAKPSLFVQAENLSWSHRGWKFFMIEDEVEKETKITKINAPSLQTKFVRPLLVGSCNGLLAFNATRHASFVYVINPVTDEKVTILVPRAPGYLICIFFHPSTREYTLLYVFTQHNCCQYFIYGLRVKRWREIASFSSRPSSGAPPAIMNGYLHWIANHEFENESEMHPCRNAIMAFSMDTEGFRALPHPGYECSSKKQSHRMMRLFEMKERLSLCHKIMCSLLIDVWVLEDYGNWEWVKSYKVRLDNWDVTFYPFKIPDSHPRVTLYKIRNDELLLDWYGRGLFCYHLKLNSVREIKRGEMRLPPPWDTFCRTFAYTKSLVTLNDLPNET